jgi:hypothetical protein
MRAEFVRMMVENKNMHQKQDEITSHKLIKKHDIASKRRMNLTDIIVDPNVLCIKKLKTNVEVLKSADSTRIVAAQSLLELLVDADNQ